MRVRRHRPRAGAGSGAAIVGLRLLLVVAVVLAWEAATGGLGLGWRAFETAILARPSRIAADIVDYARSGLLGRDLQTTLGEAFLGLALGTAGGIAVGLLFGYQRTLAAVFEPIMVALNSLPRITVAPILILWFGLGLTSKVALSLFTVFFVVFFNTFLGVRTVDPELVKAVRVMGGGPRHVVRMVVVPTVASWVFAALRTSVSFALSGAVVGEFVGATGGLGYRMLLAAGLLHTERVFAIMIFLMVVAVALVELSRRVEVYMLRWRPGAVDMG
ncbi:MAG: ABC transporter permease [Armatimonadota bacterium]|nr:ABC transporter permease [Armatimonadota bacterium]MDR7535739.1 ABC transporter permease [Armatimonadota bacterium]